MIPGHAYEALYDIFFFLLFLTFKFFLVSLHLNFFKEVLKTQNIILKKNHGKELGDFIR